MEQREMTIVRTCIHELAHQLICNAMGAHTVTTTTVVEKGNSWGNTEAKGEGDLTRKQDIMATVAGYIGECIWANDTVSLDGWNKNHTSGRDRKELEAIAATPQELMAAFAVTYKHLKPLIPKRN